MKVTKTRPKYEKPKVVTYGEKEISKRLGVTRGAVVTSLIIPK